MLLYASMMSVCWVVILYNLIILWANNDEKAVCDTLFELCNRVFRDVFVRIIVWIWIVRDLWTSLVASDDDGSYISCQWFHNKHITLFVIMLLMVETAWSRTWRRCGITACVIIWYVLQTYTKLRTSILVHITIMYLW